MNDANQHVARYQHGVDDDPKTLNNHDTAEDKVCYEHRHAVEQHVVVQYITDKHEDGRQHNDKQQNRLRALLGHHVVQRHGLVG